MRIRFALVGLLFGSLLVQPGLAQKATEMFIPIGESPGVSGRMSVIGTVESVDLDHRTFTIRNASGTFRVELTDETRIWLDRSDQGRANERGAWTDCKGGRLGEVKFVYEAGTRTTRAEWIKIRPAS